MIGQNIVLNVSMGKFKGKKKRRTTKEEEWEKKDGEVEIGANLREFLDKS